MRAGEDKIVLENILISEAKLLGGWVDGGGCEESLWKHPSCLNYTGHLGILRILKSKSLDLFNVSFTLNQSWTSLPATSACPIAVGPSWKPRIKCFPTCMFYQRFCDMILIFWCYFSYLLLQNKSLWWSVSLGVLHEIVTRCWQGLESSGGSTGTLGDWALLPPLRGSGPLCMVSSTR